MVPLRFASVPLFCIFGHITVQSLNVYYEPSGRGYMRIISTTMGNKDNCRNHMKGYIYKYTFPDGKIYIGQTRRPIEMRHAEHLNPSTGPLNPGFWEAYQTVGTPELAVIETIESDDVTTLIDQLNRQESSYIYKEKATDPAFGYNRRMIATTYSPDISILDKECCRLCQQIEEEMQPFFDTLSKKLLQGEEDQLTEEERAFVEAYIDHNNIFVHSGPQDEEVKEGAYMDEDDDFEDFMLGEAIDYAIWLYMEETREIIYRYVAENASEIIRRAKQGKIIQQLDMDGNVLREFGSHDEIREAFNIVRLDNILNVVKGRQKSAYGFRWRYKPV